ncbi:MAG TPA: hypothetical protein VNX21_06745 [Candidatus Thermoplasmatota archaeon]|nr:hypothetical protein [Candidatus Thermoplasmatota archaeon]
MTRRTHAPRRKTLRLALLLLVALSATGLVLNASATRQADAALGVQERVVEVEWMGHYRDVRALAADADLVVVGTPVAIAHVGPPAGDPDALFTFYRFDVERALQGDAPDALLVRMTGGDVPGLRVRIADEPMLETGARYLLFLRRAGPDVALDGELPYFILGGPQGQFSMRGDVVSSADARLATADWVPLKARDVPLAAFWTGRAGESS